MAKYIVYYFLAGALIVFLRVIFMSDEKSKTLTSAVDKHVQESILAGLNPKVVIGLSSMAAVVWLACIWPVLILRIGKRK